uniref:Aminotransferase class I/classII domain-containing protein n=1 Tax=Acrobeloides nanus TaxID=290746 RepID=A0A914C9L8_9BILA
MENFSINSGHFGPWTSNVSAEDFGLASRANRLLASKETATTIYKEIFADPWDPVNNPQGKINLCTAENNLCEDLLNEKISSSPEIFIPPLDYLYHYPAPGGYEHTKYAIAKYLQKFISFPGDPHLNPDNFILVPGCTAAYDMLGFCLFNSGDVVLCPSPFYSRLYDNFQERAQVEIRGVPFDDLQNPKIQISQFQEALLAVKAEGKNPRAISLIVPHNPLGIVFSEEELLNLCQWVTKNDLHLIVDEVFLCTIDSEISSGKRSLLSLRFELEMLKQRLIWMWGVSKDLCLPGVRFAVIHTENEGLLKALRRLEIMQPCPPLVQHFVTCILGDHEWLRNFHIEKNRRLQENRKLAMQQLNEMQVPYVYANAGLFLFVDLRQYLSDATFDAERFLWTRMCYSRIYLNPGQFMGTSEPGWFRLVISGRKDALAEGLHRLSRLLVHLPRRNLNLKAIDIPIAIFTRGDSRLSKESGFDSGPPSDLTSPESLRSFVKIRKLVQEADEKTLDEKLAIIAGQRKSDTLGSVASRESYSSGKSDDTIINLVFGSPETSSIETTIFQTDGTVTTGGVYRLEHRDENLNLNNNQHLTHTNNETFIIEEPLKWSHDDAIAEAHGLMDLVDEYYVEETDTSHSGTKNTSTSVSNDSVVRLCATENHRYQKFSATEGPFAESTLKRRKPLRHKENLLKKQRPNSAGEGYGELKEIRPILLARQASEENYLEEEEDDSMRGFLNLNVTKNIADDSGIDLKPPSTMVSPRNDADVIQEASASKNLEALAEKWKTTFKSDGSVETQTQPQNIKTIIKTQDPDIDRLIAIESSKKPSSNFTEEELLAIINRVSKKNEPKDTSIRKEEHQENPQSYAIETKVEVTEFAEIPIIHRKSPTTFTEEELLAIINRPKDPTWALKRKHEDKHDDVSKQLKEAKTIVTDLSYSKPDLIPLQEHGDRFQETSPYGQLGSRFENNLDDENNPDGFTRKNLAGEELPRLHDELSTINPVWPEKQIFSREAILELISGKSSHQGLDHDSKLKEESQTSSIDSANIEAKSPVSSLNTQHDLRETKTLVTDLYAQPSVENLSYSEAITDNRVQETSKELYESPKVEPLRQLFTSEELFALIGRKSSVEHKSDEDSGEAEPLISQDSSSSSSRRSSTSGVEATISSSKFEHVQDPIGVLEKTRDIEASIFSKDELEGSIKVEPVAIKNMLYTEDELLTLITRKRSIEHGSLEKKEKEPEKAVQFEILNSSVSTSTSEPESGKLEEVKPITKDHDPDDDPWGTTDMLKTSTSELFSKEDIEVLISMAKEAGVEIENPKVEETHQEESKTDLEFVHQRAPETYELVESSPIEMEPIPEMQEIPIDRSISRARSKTSSTRSSSSSSSSSKSADSYEADESEHENRPHSAPSRTLFDDEELRQIIEETRRKRSEERRTTHWHAPLDLVFAPWDKKETPSENVEMKLAKKKVVKHNKKSDTSGDENQISCKCSKEARTPRLLYTDEELLSLIWKSECDEEEKKAHETESIEEDKLDHDIESSETQNLIPSEVYQRLERTSDAQLELESEKTDNDEKQTDEVEEDSYRSLPIEANVVIKDTLDYIQPISQENWEPISNLDQDTQERFRKSSIPEKIKFDEVFSKHKVSTIIEEEEDAGTPKTFKAVPILEEKDAWAEITTSKILDSIEEKSYVTPVRTQPANDVEYIPLDLIFASIDAKIAQEEASLSRHELKKHQEQSEAFFNPNSHVLQQRYTNIQDLPMVVVSKPEESTPVESEEDGRRYSFSRRSNSSSSSSLDEGEAPENLQEEERQGQDQSFTIKHRHQKEEVLKTIPKTPSPSRTSMEYEDSRINEDQEHVQSKPDTKLVHQDGSEAQEVKSSNIDHIPLDLIFASLDANMKIDAAHEGSSMKTEQPELNVIDERIYTAEETESPQQHQIPESPQQHQISSKPEQIVQMEIHEVTVTSSEIKPIFTEEELLELIRSREISEIQETSKPKLHKQERNIVISLDANMKIVAAHEGSFMKTEQPELNVIDERIYTTEETESPQQHQIPESPQQHQISSNPQQHQISSKPEQIVQMEIHEITVTSSEIKPIFTEEELLELIRSREISEIQELSKPKLHKQERNIVTPETSSHSSDHEEYDTFPDEIQARKVSEERIPVQRKITPSQDYGDDIAKMLRMLTLKKQPGQELPDKKLLFEEVDRVLGRRRDSSSSSSESSSDKESLEQGETEERIIEYSVYTKEDIEALLASAKFDEENESPDHPRKSSVDKKDDEAIHELRKEKFHEENKVPDHPRKSLADKKNDEAIHEPSLIVEEQHEVIECKEHVCGPWNSQNALQHEELTPLYTKEELEALLALENAVVGVPDLNSSEEVSDDAASKPLDKAFDAPKNKSITYEQAQQFFEETITKDAISVNHQMDQATTKWKEAQTIPIGYTSTQESSYIVTRMEKTVENTPERKHYESINLDLVFSIFEPKSKVQEEPLISPASSIVQINGFKSKSKNQEESLISPASSIVQINGYEDFRVPSISYKDHQDIGFVRTTYYDPHPFEEEYNAREKPARTYSAESEPESQIAATIELNNLPLEEKNKKEDDCSIFGAKVHQMHTEIKITSRPRKPSREDEKHVVIEHVNITEVVYEKDGFGDGDGRRKNLDSTMKNRERSMLHYFPMNEKGPRYYVVEKFNPSDNFDLHQIHSDSIESYSIEEPTSTPPSYELILGLNDAKEVVSKDVAIQTPNPVDLCCRLRLVSRKSQMGSNFVPESAVETQEQKREEFLVCRNPGHIESGDHCCSKRLYTIKSSTMPREKKGITISTPTVASRKHNSNLHSSNDSRRSSTSSSSSSNSIDRISVRHSPVSTSWVVSSVYQSTPSGYERCAVAPGLPITILPDVVRIDINKDLK